VARLLRVPQRPPGLVGRHFRIPCCYQGEYAPDLAATFPAPAAVVALHTGQDFLVYCIGFLPGFTYLGELPAELERPRLPVPRTSVPAGSVGIAGRQTGIYPVASPGGWRIIGRTPVRLFDPNRTPPAALRPGDRVRFYPIQAAEHRRLAEERPWPLPS
jgi:inhibitor of KinA